MQIPFYLSFREFENQYYNNLEKWFENDINASEIDFLKFMKNMYKPFLSYSFSEDKLQAEANIIIKNTIYPSHERFGISYHNTPQKSIHCIEEHKTISLMEYAQYILDRIHHYLQKNKISIKENETIRDYINHYAIITEKNKLGYQIDYAQHQKLLPFLNAFIPVLGSTVDISLYRNFFYSIVKIANFIDQKFKEIQAFELSIYQELLVENTIQIHMRNQTFLTICN